MTDDRVRELAREVFHQEQHAAGWVPGENVLRNAADAFAHDSLTTANCADFTRELFAWLRDLAVGLPEWLQFPASRVLDWLQARAATKEAAIELSRRLLRQLDG
jgi:hypothetical protein